MARAQENLVELLLRCDAARRASAARTTVVLPHFAYALRVVLDDEIAKGSTVLELPARLHERDVPSIRMACTHGLFAGGALARVGDQDDVLEIVCTDTVPIHPGQRHAKLVVLSLASALDEAIPRIHNGESVSAQFDT